MFTKSAFVLFILIFDYNALADLKPAEIVNCKQKAGVGSISVTSGTYFQNGKMHWLGKEKVDKKNKKPFCKINYCQDKSLLESVKIIPGTRGFDETQFVIVSIDNESALKTAKIQSMTECPTSSEIEKCFQRNEKDKSVCHWIDTIECSAEEPLSIKSIQSALGNYFQCSDTSKSRAFPWLAHHGQKPHVPPNEIEPRESPEMNQSTRPKMTEQEKDEWTNYFLEIAPKSQNAQ